MNIMHSNDAHANLQASVMGYSDYKEAFSAVTPDAGVKLNVLTR